MGKSSLARRSPRYSLCRSSISRSARTLRLTFGNAIDLSPDCVRPRFQQEDQETSHEPLSDPPHGLPLVIPRLQMPVRGEFIVSPFPSFRRESEPAARAVPSCGLSLVAD